MGIDENYAFEITEKLSFPRLEGSEGARKAKEFVSREFEKAGYSEIKREKFKTSMSLWNATRYFFLFEGLLLLTLPVSLIYFKPAIPFITAIFIFSVFKFSGWTHNSGVKLSKNEKNNYESENIYVEQKGKGSRKKIVLLAHWDSKSQTFPSLLRIVLFTYFAFGSLALSFSYVIISLISIFLNKDFVQVNNILNVLCITVSISGLVNFFNKTGNKSPASTDNAAAVGVLITLAKYFKQHPLENSDLIFLSTGSEELNLAGSETFIGKHENEFDRENAYFINLDGIGGRGEMKYISSFGIPRKSSSEKLNSLLSDSAKDLGIGLSPLYLPTGAWSDFIPLIRRGFEACWLVSKGIIAYVHTPADNIQLVSKKGLRECILLCKEVVKRLDE